MNSDALAAHDAASQDDPVLGLLTAPDVESAKRASAPLLQTPAAAKAAKDPRLGTAFELWWTKANDPAAPERLAALAMTWRLSSLSAMNVHRRRLNELAAMGIAPNLAPLSTLPDPKDRRAVAEALSAAPVESWTAQYAAAAIVSDPDPKSDARDAMCTVLLRQCLDIGQAFALLSQAFKELKMQQQDPVAGRARRATWLLRSLRTPLYEEELVQAKEDFGERFASFVSTSLGSGPTSDRSALIESVREIIVTLNTIVRLHGLRVATHSETYSAIQTLRRRFEATDWPEDIAEPVEKLSHRVAEALLVMARQGIADAGLRRVYVTLLGTVSAASRLKRLVSANEGLDSDIAYWLETGQARERMESASAIEETATALVDLELARALREAAMADYATDSGGDAASNYRQMGREIREAARKRGIALRGRPGEIVDFSPLEHNADASVVGHRRVVVVSPLVERLASGRSVAILVKAQVKAPGEN
jgi:hypothetical protein